MKNINSNNTPQTKPRPIYSIAADIRRDWKNVNFAAKPYLQAMDGLNAISDSYYFDTGHEIVLRFLCNASSWRGEVAKKIKLELKTLVK